MESETIEVAALGRPLFPGMLYDCRKDSFIPGVTLWDKKSLYEDLDTHTQLQTDLKFCSSDSLSDKSSLLNVSASLKASFLGGLVKVGGSAKYLRDTKSSNQQSRVIMHFSETSRFDQLTMTQLGKITYPQVFDQQTATHVVTAVLYGAQAVMVFDRTFSEDENKQEIEGNLNVMVKKIPKFSIEGKGALKLGEDEKNMAENISCTFYGDYQLQQNPTTYMEALQVYKQLPTLLKDNPQNVVPVKVWLYPLHLLDTKAAQFVREINTSLISNAEEIIEELVEVERRCNDLFRNSLVNVFSDIKERLHSYQISLSKYKLVLQRALRRVLPGIRGGGMEQQSLEDILNIHNSSPFNASMLNQWLDDAKSELNILTFSTKSLKGIKTVDTDSLTTVLLDPDIDVVVCLTFTSLKYEEPYLSALKDFLKSEDFKGLEKELSLSSFAAVGKWFNDQEIITKMRENYSHFKGFSEANKGDKRICFIVSAIPDSSLPGTTIYLYENGKLIDKQFQPVSKPPPPIVVNISDKVTLKLQKSPTADTMHYKVEYKADGEEIWHIEDTLDEICILKGLKLGEPHLVRYRVVSKEGISEASDSVRVRIMNTTPVIVGGQGGDAFSILTSPIGMTLRKIRVSIRSYAIASIAVTLSDGQEKTFGIQKTEEVKEFLFDENDQILEAVLWPTSDNDRLGGFELIVVRMNGTTTFSAKCDSLGNPQRIDVKSGKCYGMVGRSGDDIDALGFYFV